ncbi:MAG: GTPase Era [Rhodothermales bacterium]
MESPPLFSDDIPAGHRSGYVALIGQPNVGKSTLINALVGQKLSIVTPKPQTTRHRILGILSAPAYQIVLLDTPGIIEPRYRLQEAMMRNVRQAISDADILLFMADATRDTPDSLSLSFVGERPSFLLLNKVDLIRQEDALPLAQAYLNAYPFKEVFPISALKGFNLASMLDKLVSYLPEGPPFYPKDQLSEHPERFFIAEIIREKIFMKYSQEVPYSTQVNVVNYEEREGQKDLLHAEIVVERDSQKAILIGKGGSALKRIGIAARKDIEAFTGRPVYMQLHVKVRDRWRSNDTFLRSFGFDA